MAIFTIGDKFGVAAANRLVYAQGGGGTAAEGEVRLNDVTGTWTWQRYNGASWDDIASLTGGNNDQFLRGDKTWKCVPINYTGEVVIDSNNSSTLMIKVPTAVSSVKLKLVGGTFPTWNYTELAYHDHGGTAASSTHTHSFSDSSTSSAASATAHTHAVSGNTDYEDIGGAAGNHRHPISFTSGSGGVAHTHSTTISGTTGTPSATGSISGAGISGYTLNDTAKVNITDAIVLSFSET